jgi:hypothetical protein
LGKFKNLLAIKGMTIDSTVISFHLRRERNPYLPASRPNFVAHPPSNLKTGILILYLFREAMECTNPLVMHKAGNNIKKTVI